jgi:DNA-binding NtrC family response regulator
MPTNIQNLRCSEIDMIKHAISIYPNKSEAARRLGISRDKLYRKLREINGNAPDEKSL